VLDNVIFDANSFTAAGQTVTLNQEGFCKDFRWTGVTNNPTFSATNLNLNVGGNFVVMSTPFVFNHTNANVSISGYFLVDGSNMSFSKTGGSITVGGDFSILNASCAFTNNGLLSTGGSFTLNSSCTFNQTATVIFTATTAGKTITNAGKTFTNVRFNGAGGEWILQDDFKATGTTEHYTGTFRSNGKKVDYGQIFNGDDNGTVRTLDYTGTDTVRVQYQYRLNTSASTVLTMGGAVLLLRTTLGTNQTIEGGGKTFGTVVINHHNTSSAYSMYFNDANTVYGNVFMRVNNLSAMYIVNGANTFGAVSLHYTGTSNNTTSESFITGINTFGNFTITSAGVLPRLYSENNNTFGQVDLCPGTSWRIVAGRTQSLTGLIADGTCQKNVSIVSTSPTAANITDTNGGTNTIERPTLQYINFGGAGATWAANTLNATGTVGITISLPASQTFYWIGGTGNWNDVSKWSLSSGGTASGCLPSRVDNVVFDNNSFLGSNQTVTLNTSAEVVDMTWTAGVNASPNFSGGNTLIINGDLTVAGNMDWQLSGGLTLRKSIVLNSAMTWSHANTVYFSGTTAGNTINMAGKTLSSSVVFDNPGSTAAGTWTLAADFTVSSSYYTQFNDATFVSGGFKVDFGTYMEARNNNVPKVLDFTGTDTVRVQTGWYMLSGTNATLTMGTAVLLMRYSSTGSMNFYGGGKTYHDIRIDGRYTTYSQYYSGGYYYNNPYSHYIYLYDNATVCRDIYFNLSGIQYVSWQNGFNSRNVYVNYTNTNTGYVPNFTVAAAQTMNRLQFTSPFVQPTLYLNTANTIDTLHLHHGMDVYFAYSQTQALESLQLTTSCLRTIDLYSTSSGSQAILSDAAGTNALEYVTLRDIRAQGGATWTAATLSATNTTGIAVTDPVSRTFYWVGGTGNWSDPSKWALSSGGSPANCLPIRLDNVVFDNNSFPGSNQTVTLNTNAEVANMTWTAGVNASPNFSGGNTLIINGDLTVAGNMDWQLSGELTLRKSIILNSAMTWSHANTVYFSGTTAGNTINMAGKTFSRSVVFDNPGSTASGAWTLGADFTVSPSYTTQFNDATFTSGGFKVDFGNYLDAQSVNPKTLNFTGTDTVRVQTGWYMLSGTNATLTMGTAVLLLRQPGTSSASMIFYSGGKTYHDVVIESRLVSGSNLIYLYDNATVCRDIYFNLWGNQVVSWGGSFNSRNVYFNYSSSNISYNPQVTVGATQTINRLRFTSPAVQPRLYLNAANTIDTLQLHHGMDVYFASGLTQTLEALIAPGTCLRWIDLYGSTYGTQATLSDAAGTNTLEYVNLQDIRATGGATWNATPVASLNVTGINLTPDTRTYYWIGGTGNWSDGTKWSLSSGGTPAGCIPGVPDDVVFDENSFPGSNQTVTLNNWAEVNNMTWTAGVNASPNFAGSSVFSLTINGDLTVAGNMDWQLSSSMTLRKSILLNSNMTWTHSNTVTFSGTTTGNTINMAGKTFVGPVVFDNRGNSATGAWTLGGDFTVSSNHYTLFNDATFISGGFEVNFGNYLDARTNSVPKVLNFTGTDTVRVQTSWQMLSGTNATLTMGTAVLLLRQPNTSSSQMYFYGGGKIYHDIVIDSRSTSSSNVYDSGYGIYIPLHRPV
jgi:hypothetical protein